MRKPILEGQSNVSPKIGAYQFVRWGASRGYAIFREGQDGKPEVFAARSGGVSGWRLIWRATEWEFCRTATALD